MDFNNNIAFFFSSYRDFSVDKNFVFLEVTRQIKVLVDDFQYELHW